MRRTLAFAVPALLLFAAPSVARADDGISLVKFGVGPMVAVGGNFLGKPGDKSYPGTVDVYPGFSGTEFGFGGYVEGRILGLVGIEVDFLRYSGKASGDITINNTAGTLEITQTATHIPVLAKGVLPLPVVAPFIFVGPEFVLVSDNGASVSGDLGKFVTANGAHSDNYKYWTFGFGLEIKLPVPDLDIRIPISIRGSYNPSVSDHVVDRWTITPAPPNFATNNQFQYMAQGAVGVGIYF